MANYLELFYLLYGLNQIKQFNINYSYSQNRMSYIRIHFIFNSRFFLRSYFSWFQDCFTNATEPCSGAMEYVTFGLYSLVGRGEEVLCENTPMKCDRAPSDEDGEPGDHSEENVSKKPDKQVGEPTKEPTKVHKKSASNQLLPTCHVVISILCMLFSRHLF